MYGLFEDKHFGASLAILKKLFLTQLPKNRCSDLPLLLAALGVEANRGVVSSFSSEPIAMLIPSSPQSPSSTALIKVKAILPESRSLDPLIFRKPQDKENNFNSDESTKIML
uniref:Uncharacterized protein n=1 Tax=Glossina palpalis gambiensis TaxID=67801 RepID=A0A1B0BHN2_9MUSC